MVREAFPQMPIHLSVQANAVNWATVKFWQQMGLSPEFYRRPVNRIGLYRQMNRHLWKGLPHQHDQARIGGSMKRMRWAKSFMWWSTLPRITPS
jgi:hypothetical protein